MDKCRKKRYHNNKNDTKEVVKMISIPPTKTERKSRRARFEVEVEVTRKKRKRSALEISDAIGVYGAFNRTLVDLHKQGR